MADNYIVRKRKLVEISVSDVRARLSATVRGHLGNLISAREWQRLRDVANGPVAEAVYDSANILTKDRIDRNELARNLRVALAEKEEMERPQLDCIAKDDEELARTLCLWLCDGAVRGAAATSRKAAESEPADAFPDALRPRGRVTRPNRWEAVSILVSPDSPTKRTERSALNLFSAEGLTLSPAALHVLCQLEEGPLHGIAIKGRLATLGFTLDQSMQALMDMAEIDRRLIYCTVRDHAFGLSGWFDGYHEVRITSAGSNYLNEVAATPAYLQWSLLEPRDLYARLGVAALGNVDSGSVRLRLVLAGLRLVRADEKVRISSVVRSNFDSHGSLSPLSWVFFGSLGRFIRDIANYQALDAKDIAEEFLDFARELYADLHSSMIVIPDSWGRSLGNAELELSERFS